MVVLRRLLALLAAIAGAVLLVGLASGVAAAADEQVDSYQVDLTVRPDGTLHVREQITYDLGTQQRHGIYRTIPVQYPYSDTYDRLLRVSNIRVVSTTGAPTDVSAKTEGSSLVIRVGDPNRTITGRQVYVLDYDIQGALNTFADHIEVFWNAVGPEWAVPITAAAATLRAPQAPTQVACYAGPTGSSLPCSNARIEGSTALYGPQPLAPYEALTVVAALPTGSVAVPPMILRERFSVARAFSVTPWTATGGLGILVVGLGGVGYLLWTRGRDRRWRDQIPGLAPAPGQETDAEPRPLFTDAAGPVEYSPPDDVRPGQMGTLVDERAQPLDVTATIVDLAVRGYLHIEELERKRLFASRDWRLTQQRPPDPALLAYERTLLEALFKGRSEVLVSELKRTFATDLRKVESQLYDDVVKSGWFRRRPDRTRGLWGLLGVVAVLAGVGLTYLLARYTHAGLLGVAVVVSGLLLLLVSGRMPARTAKGSAMLARVLGFRTYLHTAEAEQLRFEERTDVFSKYLPYAIVFGDAERWAKAFAALAAAQAAGGTAVAPVLPWYTGPAGWDLGHLGDSISSFATTTAGAIATTASSGGSGFSGGSSGGGFGGGGGGSW